MLADPSTISAFLTLAGWQGAQRLPLAGDASSRRYERLAQAGQSAILMIAPPDPAFSRFIQVDEWLLAKGFSAPAILAADHGNGLMLLEDFGDDLLARLLRAHPSQEASYYRMVTDFLLTLHQCPPPDFIAPLDGPALAELLALTVEWYPQRDPGAAQDVPAAFLRAYAALPVLPAVLSLRDFHAENVIWLPRRLGAAKLGLLDFQDAVRTHPAYDLVSALQDARRKVSAAVEQAEIRRYAQAARYDLASFSHAYALLGAQRALRILGIFARLALRDGKPHYLRFLPGVWENLERNLSHPALENFRHLLGKAFLNPSASHLGDMPHDTP